MTPDRFGVDAALYSLKTFTAAMLAYYIALRIGLPRPFWAILTVYITSQPLAGAVLSKGVFRVIGTVIGAIVTVILVPNLVNAPEMLVLGLAGWLGVCVYLAQLDRSPRSYIFLLAGYTTSLIGFPSVTTPNAIFTIASLRVQEIVLGILSACLIHGLLFPKTVTAHLLKRVATIIDDAEHSAREAIAADAGAVARDRRRLAIDIFDLHQLSIHLPFDTARLLPGVRTVRALQDQLSMILPLTEVVGEHIRSLRDECIAADLAHAIARADTWLATDPALRSVVDPLVESIERIAPAVDQRLDIAATTRLALVMRLGELMRAIAACRLLQVALAGHRNIPASPRIAALLSSRLERPLHRDRGLALRGALATMISVVAVCTFWIGLAWNEGATAALIAGTLGALFSGLDDPMPAVKQALVAVSLGVLCSACYTFVILPGVTDFPLLVAVLAPAFLYGGILQARGNPYAFGLLMTLPTSIGLTDRYSAASTSFIESNIALVIGVAAAAVPLLLLRTIDPATKMSRLLRAGWRDLARRSVATGRPDTGGWISHMLDRVGLMGGASPSHAPEVAAPLHELLVTTRVGILVDALRLSQVELGNSDHREMLAGILGDVGDFYARRGTADERPPAQLRTRIDNGFSEFAADAPSAAIRNVMLALFSLRRNLFADPDPIVESVT